MLADSDLDRIFVPAQVRLEDGFREGLPEIRGDRAGSL